MARSIHAIVFISILLIVLFLISEGDETRLIAAKEQECTAVLLGYYFNKCESGSANRGRGLGDEVTSFHFRYFPLKVRRSVRAREGNMDGTRLFGFQSERIAPGESGRLRRIQRARKLLGIDKYLAKK
jgi:hypothetical protein